MKKYICLILCLVLLVSLFACKKQEPEPQEQTTEAEQTTAAPPEKKDITLGYYSEKPLNPFTTDSPTNRNITTLIYDCLYVLDEDYRACPVIAQSSEISDMGITVKINSELYFSSGAPITPYDVVYSFNLAKQSSFYSGRLGNILSAAASSDSVIFSVGSKKLFTEACLSFPVVQSSTGENDIPVGSGRYTLQQDSQGRFLKENESSSRAELLETKIIRLMPISSPENELYMLQSGDLFSFFDDMSDGEYTRIGANMIKVPLNNMLYLGFNSTSEQAMEPCVKQAITLCVDTSAIAAAVFSGMSRSAAGPFNPDWYVLEGATVPVSEVSPVKAVEVLEQGGYVFAYENNEFRSKDFEYLSLRMIVNEETAYKTECARMIHSAIAALGIDITLDILPFEEYTEALRQGEYDLYLGEVKLSPDMSLSCFFDENAGLGYGIDRSSTVALSYKDFTAGTTDIGTFLQVFSSELPFLPICYRDAMAYFSRALSFEGSITEYEPFLNAYSWEVAE